MANQFFRLKTTWLETNPNDGGVSKVKTEELVEAGTYTEAEALAYEIADKEDRSNLGDIDIEIVRMKPTELVYQPCLSEEAELFRGLIKTMFDSDEPGNGLYLVNYDITTVDEKTGKEKTSKSSMYVPATSNKDAYECVCKVLKPAMFSWTIKDIKFDKAQAIYLNTSTYKSITDNYDRA